VSATVAVVILSEVVAGVGSPFNKIHHLSAQFLALFALGVLVVKLGQGETGEKLRRPLTVLGAAILAGVAVLAVVKGSVWMVNGYFWVDLVFGLGIACLMTAMLAGGLAPARAILSSRVALSLGLFSYSIYLLHGPLVAIIDQNILAPLHLAPLVTFGLLLVLGLPAILAICYGFHLMFEAPFLRRRDMSALRAMPLIGRLLPKPRPVRVYTPAPAEAVAAAHDGAPSLTQVAR
jgi:peptidoglycan/LPS O-acetylase OafA/YrhL